MKLKCIKQMSYILLIALALSACSTLNEFAVFGDQNSSKLSFDGIKQMFQKKKHLNIIFIHGMSGYSNSDPEPLIDRIKLQYPQLTQSEKIEVTKFNNKNTKGKLVIEKTWSENKEESIHYYTLYWQDVVRDHKSLLNEDKEIKYTDLRLDLMNRIKQGLLNNALADVALYMGKYKSAMQRPIQNALKEIDKQNTRFSLNVKAKAKRKSSNVLITFSLGSTMLFDTLDKMNRGPISNRTSKNIARRFTNQTRLFFMLANQIPIIHLSEIEPPIQSRSKKIKKWEKNKSTDNAESAQQICSTSSTKALCNFISNRIQPKDKTNLPWIIAISDPNDLLSYPIFNTLRDNYPNTFISVYTSIAKKAYGFSKYKIVIPKKAHTGYGTDEKTIQLILNGYRPHKTLGFEINH